MQTRLVVMVLTAALLAATVSSASAASGHGRERRVERDSRPVARTGETRGAQGAQRPVASERSRVLAREFNAEQQARHLPPSPTAGGAGSRGGGRDRRGGEGGGKDGKSGGGDGGEGKKGSSEAGKGAGGKGKGDPPPTAVLKPKGPKFTP